MKKVIYFSYPFTEYGFMKLLLTKNNFDPIFVKSEKELFEAFEHKPDILIIEPVLPSSVLSEETEFDQGVNLIGTGLPLLKKIAVIENHPKIVIYSASLFDSLEENGISKEIIGDFKFCSKSDMRGLISTISQL